MELVNNFGIGFDFRLRKIKLKDCIDLKKLDLRNGGKNLFEFSLMNIFEFIGVIWYYVRRFILENLFLGCLFLDII